MVIQLLKFHSQSHIKPNFPHFITEMATPTSLDVKLVTTPHLDIDHLALEDRYFQIKDTVTQENLLRIHCWANDRFLNHVDNINLWESSFPKYTFPKVHPFLDIVHFYHACNIPSQRVIIAPNQDFLFSITVESINHMLQIQPSHNLTPLPIANLLDLNTTLDPTKIKQIF